MTAKKSPISRRKLLKGGAVAAGVVATTTLAAPNLALAKPKVLKVQAAWGGGIFFSIPRFWWRRNSRAVFH